MHSTAAYDELSSAHPATAACLIYLPYASTDADARQLTRQYPAFDRL
jgi:hypothetical protein